MFKCLSAWLRTLPVTYTKKKIDKNDHEDIKAFNKRFHISSFLWVSVPLHDTLFFSLKKLNFTMRTTNILFLRFKEIKNKTLMEKNLQYKNKHVSKVKNLINRTLNSALTWSQWQFFLKIKKIKPTFRHKYLDLTAFLRRLPKNHPLRRPDAPGFGAAPS